MYFVFFNYHIALSFNYFNYVIKILIEILKNYFVIQISSLDREKMSKYKPILVQPRLDYFDLRFESPLNKRLHICLNLFYGVS